MTEQQVRDYLAQYGHGHIVPRTDGTRMRCSGTMSCQHCRNDEQDLAQTIKNDKDKQQKQPKAQLSFNDFVLTRTDLECFNLEPNSWRASLQTTAGYMEAFGTTREEAHKRLFRTWVDMFCPDPA